MPKRPKNRRVEKLEVLYKISNIINSTQDPEKVLKAVLKEVVRITQASSGSIAMLDPRRGILDIRTAINIPTKTWKRLKLQLGVGVTGWAAYKGESVRVDDVRRESRYVRLKPDIRSELAVPLILHGDVIGVINVDSIRKSAFSEDDERLLQAVAEQSAQVIETARLYESQKRHSEQMESVFEVGRQLASPAPMADILDRVAREGRALLDADACVFVEVDEANQRLTIRGQAGGIDEWLASPSMDLNDSLLAPVIRKHRTLSISNFDAQKQFWAGKLDSSGGYSSLLAVPVVYQEQMIGSLAVLSIGSREYTEQEKNLLQLLGNHTAVALETTRRQDRILTMEENLHRVERLNLLGTLAAEIAHEIRNPITIINLMLSSIADETAHLPQVSEDLNIVREKVDRIDRIVDQTLTMGRRQNRVLQKVEINSAVSDVLLFLSYKFVKSGVGVRTHFGEELPEITGDRGQIQQVLLNLMMNAVEAMDNKGKVVLRTSVEHDPELGLSVVFSVSDSGKGISKSDIDSLFEPFFTTRERGTGLGLFISQRIVNNHGGTIRVQSKEGKGSTFSVLLPVEPPEDLAMEMHDVELVKASGQAPEIQANGSKDEGWSSDGDLMHVWDDYEDS